MRHGKDTRPFNGDSYWAVEGAGCPGGGWSDDDPNAEEAMAALATLSRVNYDAAMASLRRSGEEGLERLRNAEQLGSIAIERGPIEI